MEGRRLGYSRWLDRNHPESEQKMTETRKYSLGDIDILKEVWLDQFDPKERADEWDTNDWNANNTCISNFIYWLWKMERKGRIDHLIQEHFRNLKRKSQVEPVSMEHHHPVSGANIENKDLAAILNNKERYLKNEAKF